MNLIDLAERWDNEARKTHKGLTARNQKVLGCEKKPS